MSDRLHRVVEPARLHGLVCALPKAELHVHIEGTLEPDLMLALARRHGAELPYRSRDEVLAAYSFADLQSFLDIYYTGASVLRTVEDFDELAFAYLQRAADDNVVHAELFFDPQTHTGRGIPFDTVITGLRRGMARAAQSRGISAQLIMCFLRHLSEAQGFETLEMALAHREHIVGVGLDSSERGHPPQKFERLFARCRELGFRLVAHAGEEGPAAYIHAALDVLRVERIDHGVRCLEDPALVARLAAEGVPLTVCPLSNVKLGVFRRMQDHPLRRLLDAGLVATVNSDDPAYFGGGMNANWLAVFDALDLGPHHACLLAKHSFDASFLPDADKARWRDTLESRFAALLGWLA
jgi:adenine deaminase